MFIQQLDDEKLDCTNLRNFSSLNNFNSLNNFSLLNNW